jgi:hypothetical protein
VAEELTADLVAGQIDGLANAIDRDLVALGRPSAREIARLLIAVRDLRADLGETATTLETVLVQEMGRGRKLELPGYGLVEVRKRWKRSRWDWSELLPVIAARIVDDPATIFDPETGEVLPPAVIGANVATRLRDAISFSSAKVTALREMGIQVDEFCEEEPDGYAVQLPARVFS